VRHVSVQSFHVLSSGLLGLVDLERFPPAGPLDLDSRLTNPIRHGNLLNQNTLYVDTKSGLMFVIVPTLFQA